MKMCIWHRKSKIINCKTAVKSLKTDLYNPPLRSSSMEFRQLLLSEKGRYIYSTVMLQHNKITLTITFYISDLLQGFTSSSRCDGAELNLYLYHICPKP